MFKLQEDILQIDYNNMSTSRDRLDSTLSFLFLKVKFANACNLHSSGETETAVHENN